MIKYNNDVFCLFKIFQFLQIVPVQCKQQFQASFQVQEWMDQPILCILMYESKLNKKKFFDHFIFDFYIIDLFFPKKNWHETDCILSQSVLRFVCTNLKRSPPVIKAEWAIHNEGYTIHMNKHQWYTSHSLVIAETPTVYWPRTTYC